MPPSSRTPAPTLIRRRRAAATGLAGVCAVACLGAATPSTAQTPADDLLFDERPSVFEESKYRQTLSRAPGWVSVVTAEEIRAYGHRTLADVLDSVPGLYMSDDRTYSSLGARGFGDPEDYSTRLLLLLDGVRINDGGLLDTASIGRHFLLDIDLIERIEVLRGPGSSIYGNNALTAVINVITKDGRDIGGTEVALGVGTNDAFEARVTRGGRRSGGLEYLVSANRHDSEGNPTLRYDEFVEIGESADGIARGIDAEDDTNVSVKARLGAFTLHGAFSERYKQVPTGAFGAIFNDPDHDNTDRSLFLNLAHDHAFGNGVEWHGDLSLQRQDYRSEANYFLTDPDGPDPRTITNFDETDNRWVLAQGQVTVHRFERHQLIVGADARYSNRLYRNNYDRLETYYEDDRTSWSAGAFVQDRFLLRDNLQLFAGLRHDAVKDSISATTPRVGLVWSPSGTTTVKLLYSSAFRAPNIYELWQPGPEPGTIVRNRGLDAERMVTRELVIERDIGDSWKAVANLFDFRLDDVIETGVVIEEGESEIVIRNLPGTRRTRGVDLALDGRLSGGSRVQLGVTAQTSEDRDGGALLNSPKLLIKAGFIRPLIPDELTLGLDVRHVGEREDREGETLDPFTTVNASLEVSRIASELSLRFEVHNLFDARIDSAVADRLLQTSIEQDGRTGRLTLEYRFR